MELGGEKRELLSSQSTKVVLNISAGVVKTGWTDSRGRNVTHGFEALVVSPQIMSREEKVTKGCSFFLLCQFSPVSAQT